MRAMFRSILPAVLIVCSTGTVLATEPDRALKFANQQAQGEKYRTGWFGKGETQLRYIEAGQGPLIIFYHGFPSFWYSWFDQMEALKTRYHVVAVDGLGSGESGKPQGLHPYRVKRLAAQIDGLARKLAGRERFVLVGHDWGAALAFAFAEYRPDRLRAVIGISAPPYNMFLDLVRNDRDQQARSSYMQAFRALTLEDIRSRRMGETIWRRSYGKLIEQGSIGPEEGELFRMALADPLAIHGGMNWYRANIPAFEVISDRWRWPRQRGRVNLPALVIWGEADRAFSPVFLDEMDQWGNDVRIVRMPGVEHWPMIEAPDKINAALLDFLGSVEKR
jgi:pimeloyl-ACP methyl ester carboxylesterase